MTFQMVNTLGPKVIFLVIKHPLTLDPFLPRLNPGSTIGQVTELCLTFLIYQSPRVVMNIK